MINGKNVKKVSKPILAMMLAAMSVSLGPNNDVKADDQSDFINTISSGSQRATRERNLYTSVQMAQAILESGWGKSALSREANNYFGIKGSYNGQYVIMNTAEWDEASGNYYYIDAAFRKYPSPYESMVDNADFIRKDRYSAAWRENARNYGDAARALGPQDNKNIGGYATDPGYPNKLINLIQQYNLDRFDVLTDPKYKVGDKVQIASFALNEANGYDLTNRQNWIGTIKSVKANSQSSSNYEYYIDYGNDVRSEHVLEQDIKAAPASKYKAGDLLKVADFAISESNGYDLTNHRGWTGVVKSVEINNAASSHYAYYLSFGDGSRNEHVLEQDVVPSSDFKYKVGQTVMLSNYANVGGNGENLSGKRQWIGKITKISPKNQYSSKFAYTVDWGNGQKSESVLEQDLVAAPNPKFATGQKVQISQYSNVESNGTDMTRHRGKIATIKSATVMNKYSSHYEYYVEYGDGTRSEHVLEQDLAVAPNPKFVTGQKVQISQYSNVESNGTDMTRHRGKIATIKSVAVMNKYSSHYEYYVEYGDGTRSEHVLEQDLAVAPNPKFATGQKVQIGQHANVESNGYDMVANRGKIATIKSVAVMNKYSSHYEYYVEYGDGTRSEHVLEQDLAVAPNPKFATGQKVQIGQHANVESNGYDMVANRGKIATIKSVAVMNKYSSHYEYYVEYGDGTRSEHVLEQDLAVAPNPKFVTGQKVQISQYSNVESNGYDMVANRGKIATIKSVAVMNKYSSHYEYYVEYGDGTRSEHVLEQDLSVAPDPKYKTGQSVKVSEFANVESNGTDMVRHRGKTATIKSVAVMNKYSSHYEYFILYPDGTRSEHVLEQDLI